MVMRSPSAERCLNLVHLFVSSPGLYEVLAVRRATPRPTVVGGAGRCLLPAARAAERPAGGLGDPGPAGRARRGGAPLINQSESDPGLPGLVAQDGDQVADAPVAGSLVVPPPGRQVQDAARVAHGQATGIRSRRSLSSKVPWYQRTGIIARRRRGNRAEASPLRRRAAAANQASQ
jgi:hypothetical protein